MTLFDYVTIAVFLTGLLWLGSRFYRWIGSPDDFYVAGRELGELVEVQAAGEGGPFPWELLNDLRELALKGLAGIFLLQEETLRPWLPLSW